MTRIASPLVFASFVIFTSQHVSGQSDTAPATAKLRRQLQAEDPAEIAWAAYRAGKQRVRELAPDLRGVLGQLTKKEETDPKVMSLARSVFDALVRIDTKVPAAELAPWMRRFGAMTTILAARDPKKNAGLLLRLIDGRHGDGQWQVACNLLMKAAPTMVTPKLVDQVSVILNVSVVSDDGWNSSCCVVSCGSRSMQRLDGFPHVALYSLDEGTPDGNVLVADGPQPISYSRRERAERKFRISECSSPVDRSEYALRCLAALAGQGPQERTLHSTMPVQIVWSTAAALRSTVADEIARIRPAYRDLLEALVQRKLLPKAHAAHLKLSVRIEVMDLREGGDKSTPLPKLTAVSSPARGSRHR